MKKDTEEIQNIPFQEEESKKSRKHVHTSSPPAPFKLQIRIPESAKEKKEKRGSN